MNRYFWAVLAVVFGATFLAVLLGFKYSEATVFFGLIAVISAPVVLHKVEDKNWSVGLLVGLSIFASFPFKKLCHIGDLLNEVPVTLAYAAILWVVGFGWKRNWR